MPSRRGISIIELMIVVSGVAMMLGLCAISLKLLIQLNADAQARLGTSRALERLAVQLRDDVHSCEAVELIPDPKTSTSTASLRLAMEPDHHVIYAVRDDGLVRDESRAGKPVRHESYSLPRGRVVLFAQRTEADHRLVALIVTQPAGRSRTNPPSPLEIVALPGKDRPVKQGAGS
jgi:hypothetical protein